MSTTENLQTNNPDVMLVEPAIERDALLGIEWFQGEIGRTTLASMGVANKDNEPTTLEKERNRIKDFIEKQDQLNWMIEYQRKVVGSVWANLEQVGNVPAPAVHVMIGDPEARGKGVGLAATSKVVEYLTEQGYENIYSRHLTNNSSAISLLKSLGFTELNGPYTDSDGLEWQNVERSY